jgi:hypothetical protein
MMVEVFGSWHLVREKVACSSLLVSSGVVPVAVVHPRAWSQMYCLRTLLCLGSVDQQAVILIL